MNGFVQTLRYIVNSNNGLYINDVILEAADKIEALTKQRDGLLAVLKDINIIDIGGPHSSAVDGFNAALTAVSKARYLASAAITATEQSDD